MSGRSWTAWRSRRERRAGAPQGHAGQASAPQFSFASGRSGRHAAHRMMDDQSSRKKDGVPAGSRHRGLAGLAIGLILSLVAGCAESEKDLMQTASSTPEVMMNGGLQAPIKKRDS